MCAKKTAPTEAAEQFVVAVNRLADSVEALNVHLPELVKLLTGVFFQFHILISDEAEENDMTPEQYLTSLGQKVLIGISRSVLGDKR